MPMTVRYTVLDGEILSETRNGVERDYVPDALGSTVALLDNTQTKTDTFTYWPYGEANMRSGSTATPFQFVGTRGYYRDSVSRDYVRNRVLDKQKGRWLTQDPIGLVGNDVNLYRYVWNMPITINDPKGKFVFIGIGIGIVIGAIWLRLCHTCINNLPGSNGSDKFLHCVIGCQAWNHCSFACGNSLLGGLKEYVIDKLLGGTIEYEDWTATTDGVYCGDRGVACCEQCCDEKGWG